MGWAMLENYNYAVARLKIKIQLKQLRQKAAKRETGLESELSDNYSHPEKEKADEQLLTFRNEKWGVDSAAFIERIETYFFLLKMMSR